MSVPEIGNNIYLYSAIVAAIMPALQAMVNRQSWSSEAKGGAAIAVSVMLGAGTAFFSGNWDSTDITRSVLIVFFLGQVSYQTFWKPTRLGPMIEDATGKSILKE